MSFENYIYDKVYFDTFNINGQKYIARDLNNVARFN